jgi:hypothetical protein
MYAKTLPDVSTFNIVTTQSLPLNSSQYYRHDIDIRQYTTYVSVVPYIYITNEIKIYMLFIKWSLGFRLM